MLIDLHMHTRLSDGTRTIEEMVEAAGERGYTALAITDHARGDDPAYRDIATAVRDAVERLVPETPFQLFAGVELTEFEPALIAQAAEDVRQAGAQVVVVHGECVMANITPGTDAAAVRAPGVDVLGHPGLISEDDAATAARNGIYLELSARPEHAYGNGHVYAMARRTGAQVIVDSDGHDELGLLTLDTVRRVIRGAGASEAELASVQEEVARLYNRLMHCYGATRTGASAARR